MTGGIAVFKNGIVKKDNYQYIPVGENGLKSKFVRDFYEDRLGLVWVGTKYGGLYVYEGNRGIFNHIELTYLVKNNNWVNDNFVLSLQCGENDVLWIGTRSNGLLRYHMKKKEVDILRYVNNTSIKENKDLSRIECIYKDNGNNIWVGSQHGLAKVDSKHNNLTLFPFNKVNEIYEDNKGNLWVGTVCGIYIFNKSSQKIIPFLK